MSIEQNIATVRAVYTGFNTGDGGTHTGPLNTPPARSRPPARQSG